ncbi:hypothetical protein SAMN05421786_10510 [Chryseobacterium ureilyticum]|uniref:Pectate lyase superfamily protein n=1 Tax=Chryseobacterium ureilyticum TaxID=373668 RepID=A0A1N7PAF7_9FLAO|nr:hypothetical protein [Chryseobacterium ureilyticum]SIT07613.1 hypothetical protein SAMN05421786_10510 [Chryseobacterium ureilyticum]
MATKQIEDPNTKELISLLPLATAPAYIDNIIYFSGTSQDPYPYYRRYIENYVDIRWFGAKGNDPVADSSAFEKAINFCKTSEHKILLIPEGYTFDLNDKTFDIGEITLRFTGGIIKNATLIGNGPSIYSPTSWIDAGCYQIFENITLTNNWASTNGTVWADWYGSIADDYNSVDLKTSIDALNKVFQIVTLNEGKYYSNECNIKVNSLIGQGIHKTIIDFRPRKNGDYGLLIGNKGGDTSQRTEYNVVSNLVVGIGSQTKDLKGTAGIVLGATHKPLIENVKIQNSADFESADTLIDFNANIESKHQDLNCALLIDGLGELATINNLITSSQVGVLYKTSFDFINFNNYTHWGYDFGFCTVFVGSQSGSNITFTGSQSWAKGLYGFYALPSNEEANFTNWVIENLRIEQLSTFEDSDTGKYIGASFYIGDQMWLNNFIIRNTMLAGTSNGIILNNTKTGFIELDNIKQLHDQHVKTALQVEFLPVSISCVNLKNVQIDGTFELLNSVFIEDDYSLTDETRNGISGKILNKRNCVKSVVNENIIYKQKEVILKDNATYLTIVNSNPSKWSANQKCKKIDISVIGTNTASFIKFYYFQNKTFRIVEVSKDSANHDEILVTSTATSGKFNVLVSDDLFLFNRFNEDVQVFIDHEDLVL